ncbi:MAG: HEAT repeat domain-containing protein [Phycisphaerae bacterium]|nr:HEAT repeat domain-containing protein [Phycisphaerae bacterium]
MKCHLAIITACLTASFVAGDAAAAQKSVGSCLASLEYGNPVARRNAVWFLGRLGRSDREKVGGHLLGLLGDRDRSVQLAAAAALGRCGETAVDALWKLLDDSDAKTRQVAADALAGMGFAAVPGLIKALGGRDPEGLKQAIGILGKAGPSAKAAIPLLVKMLDNDDLHLDALEALGGMMPASKSVLIEMLQDTDPVRRKQGAHALGSGGRRSQSAIADLIKALSGKCPRTSGRSGIPLMIRRPEGMGINWRCCSAKSGSW